MATFIIADLHLSNKRPQYTQALKNFFKCLKSNDKVIIAGDLFDFFVGLDPKDHLYQEIRNITLDGLNRGIKTFFICGNRDFLLDKKAARFFNFELVKNYYIEKYNKSNVLILHGDQLCTNDKEFQRFRKITNNKILQCIFMHMPLSLRNKVGEKVRNKSQNLDPIRNKDQKLFGLVDSTCKKYLQDNNCNILIHGHFHIFETKHNAFRENTCRLGLGCWDMNFSFVRIGRKIENIQMPIETLVGISPIVSLSEPNS